VCASKQRLEPIRLRDASFCVHNTPSTGSFHPSSASEACCSTPPTRDPAPFSFCSCQEKHPQDMRACIAQHKSNTSLYFHIFPYIFIYFHEREYAYNVGPFITITVMKMMMASILMFGLGLQITSHGRHCVPFPRHRSLSHPPRRV